MRDAPGASPLRSLLGNSLVYSAGSVAQRFLSVLLLPLYTRFLLPEDYGVAGLLTVGGGLLGTLTTFGLTNGISRYFYYPHQENATVEEVVWSPVAFILAASVLVLVPLTLFSGRISLALFGTGRHAYIVVLTLAGVFLANLASVGRAVLIFRERSVAVNGINLAEIAVNALSGIYLVVVRRRGIDGLIEAGLLASALTAAISTAAGVLCYRPRFSHAILAKQLRFSLPLVLAVFAFWVIDSSDRYLLKMFLPLSEVGLYNVGYSVGLAVTVLVQGFTLAWPPFYHRNNQAGEGQAVCDGVLRLVLAAGAVLVAFLSLSAPFLLRILTTEAYLGAYTVVPWIALAYLLKVPYLVFLMGIIMKDKTWWQLALEIAAAVANIAVNIVLIPLLGREAAALTTLLSYGLMSGGAYILVTRINPIPNLSGRFLLMVLGLAFLAVFAAAGAGRLPGGVVGAALLGSPALALLSLLFFRELRVHLARERGA